MFKPGFNFESSKTTWLINPRLPEEQKKRLNVQTNGFPGHFCLTTSGSEKLKWVALSHHALLTSASAVNDHLNSDCKDIWVNPLPTFHVGGLSIYARAHLSGAQVVPFDGWDPKCFCTCLQHSDATLTSLVPTQVFDLVLNHFSPPPTLRAVIVGGGALATEVYQKAKALNWPLLASYGLTEAASQAATATPLSPKLQILPHIEVKVKTGRLHLKSEALLTAYGFPKNGEIRWEDPKKEGWLVTDDLVAIESRFLQIMGRSSQFIKIGGESVHLQRLENTLQAVKLELGISTPTRLFAAKNSRLGHQIELECPAEAPFLVKAYNLRVLPYERIRKIHLSTNFTTTPLGRILKNFTNKY